MFHGAGYGLEAIVRFQHQVTFGFEHPGQRRAHGGIVVGNENPPGCGPSRGGNRRLER